MTARSARGTTAPPSTGTLASFPRDQNATHWPSGEKNGCEAPCVPPSSVTFASSNFRVNSLGVPPETEPTKTSRVASGEMIRELNVGAARGTSETSLPRSTSI